MAPHQIRIDTSTGSYVVSTSDSTATILVYCNVTSTIKNNADALRYVDEMCDVPKEEPPAEVVRDYPAWHSGKSLRIIVQPEVWRPPKCRDPYCCPVARKAGQFFLTKGIPMNPTDQHKVQLLSDRVAALESIVAELRAQVKAMESRLAFVTVKKPSLDAPIVPYVDDGRGQRISPELVQPTSPVRSYS